MKYTTFMNSFRRHVKSSAYLKHTILLIFTILLFITPAICQWVNGIGGAGQEFGQDVKADAAGNVFVTGNFSGTVDFDPGPGVFNLKSSCPCDESNPAKSDIFIAKYNPKGNFLWAIGLGGAQSDRVGGISLDAAGNVYITGQFAGRADFDPGPGTKNLTSAGSTDIFLAKYNTNGQLIWANNFGGSLNDEGTGIAIDKNGNVFVTGSFLGIADFDPGPGITSFNSNGNTDVFFAKYSTAGSLVWAKDIQGTGEQNGRKIRLDGNGNIYLTATFFGTADLDPGPGVTNLTGAGSTDPYFAKYNLNGELLWAKKIGDVFDEAALDIAVDLKGNLFITGYFVGTTDFDPGAGVSILKSSPGGLFDGFLLKLNTEGDFQWAFKTGSSGNDISQSVAVDSAGNPYICGSFQGVVDFNPSAETYNLTAGGNDLFFAKYTTTGKFLWAQNDGGPSEEAAYAIDADKLGNIYLTGYFSGSSSFKTGLGSGILTAKGNADVFLLKFSPLTLEAEDAALNGAVIAADQPGFTGTGFADYTHLSGDFIEWTVNAPETGYYTLKFRYANGGTTNRPLKLEVNGVVVSANLAFLPTGGWTVWSGSPVTTSLIEGVNKIRLTTTGFNGPNIDHVALEAATCQSATMQAEDAVLKGTIASSNQPGFTGTGFADYINTSGDFIEWTVNALAAGSVTLQFRYANGGTGDRPLKLEVNGSVVAANLGFPQTGNWAVWSVSSASANLVAGANKIRLTTIGSNGPNIDYLTFSCNNSIQALRKPVQSPVPVKSLFPVQPGLLKAVVAPNPVEDGMAKLTLSTSLHLPVYLNLVDMSGRSYRSLKFMSLNSLDLPVDDLLPGAYTIILKQGDLSTHIKLIIGRN